MTEAGQCWSGKPEAHQSLKVIRAIMFDLWCCDFISVALHGNSKSKVTRLSGYGACAKTCPPAFISKDKQDCLIQQYVS